MKKHILISLAIFSVAFNTFSQSAGPNSPSSASYSAMGCLACPGGDWNNLQNLAAVDHQYTETGLASYPSCFQGNCFYSRTLYAYDFGFSIPPGAVITGITADVYRMSTADSGLSDSSVMLYSGMPVGTDHASPNFWTTNPANQHYGDTTDSWGYSLSPDSVNSSQFGLSLIAMNKSLSATFATASIDQIQMTVYYTTGTGIQSQTRGNNSISINFNGGNSMLTLFSNHSKINALRVSDVLGNEIYSKHFSSPADGMVNVQLPLLKQGIYFVMAEVNGKTVVQKFTAE